MKRLPLFITLTLNLLFCQSTWAIGPRNVTSGGAAVKWGSMPITVNLESDLVVRGKNVAPLVSNALTTWVDLTESDVAITQGTLGVAVDNTNVCDYLFDSSACPSGPTNDGKNPLVIDADGSIAGRFFGTGNKFTTLGFASIISFSATTGAAVRGEAVFNASCLNTVEVSGCTALSLSFSDNDFTSFIVHEMGHFLGLDHSQVNLTEATDKDSSNDSLINTMFPTFIVGNGANFKVPKRDDQVALAQLYPNSTFTANTWTISGNIYQAGGTTGLQCANVIARNASSPKVDAICALSGDLATANSSNGNFTIPGLTAGSAYAITVEPIGSGFTGASGYTPCRGGSTGESAPPSFTALTSTSTYTGSAGDTKTVNCTIGGDCTGGTSGSSGSSGSGGSGGGTESATGGCSKMSN